MAQEVEAVVSCSQANALQPATQAGLKLLNSIDLLTSGSQIIPTISNDPGGVSDRFLVKTIFQHVSQVGPELEPGSLRLQSNWCLTVCFCSPCPSSVHACSG